MSHSSRAPAALIAEVSRETGLSKDTLRVWERRYGFPTPLRNDNDERLYSTAQIERLRVISRLLDRGLRPGKIVGLPLEDLISYGQRPGETTPIEAATPGETQHLFQLVKAHRAEDLHQRLGQLLMQWGLRQFILGVVVPLNTLVGNAWLAGGIEIYEEHLYTQQLLALLQQALLALPPNRAPRVLLTTLPGEAHQLGILMAQAFLAMEGAKCVSLGTQTPPGDILKAVKADGYDIVGLSCTSATGLRLASAQLASLRQGLDPLVELWVGGGNAPKDRRRVGGVRYVTELGEIPGMVANWRAQTRADRRS